jgi:hypothetical protein
MAADVAATMALWSTTESANAPTGTTAISTNLDDNLRMIQVVVRNLASPSTIASAGTTDIGANVASFLTVTGTTTITGLGTVSAGIWRVLVFSGALTFTHNASSLILPSGASITTAAGDVAMMLSLGSGNWRCLFYSKASGGAVVALSSFGDGTVGAPGLYLTTDTDTGFYKIGADSLGLTVGGVKLAEFSTANGLLVTGKSTLGPMQIAASDAIVFAMGGQAVSFTNCDGFSIDGTSSTGGDITLTGGQNGGTSGKGDIILQGGASADSGTAGSINISGGISASGTGGSVDIKAGYNSATGAGANIELSLGGTISTPGDIIVSSFDASDDNHFLKIKGATRHIHVSDTGGTNKPTILSGGGTSPTIAGTDTAFQITVGTGGSSSTVTVTFNEAWATAPMVWASHQGAVLPLRCDASTTTVAITASSAFTVGGKIDVFCIGKE